MKKRIKIFIGILVGILFLYLIFRKADVAQMYAIIVRADIKLLFLSEMLLVLSLILRSYRWKLLGERYRNIRWIYFFRATSIGLMLNVFVPFRAGDLYQGHFLSRKSNLSKSYTLSTVFLERLTDLMPPLIIIIVASLFFVMPEQIPIGQILIAITGVLLGIAFTIRFRKKFMDGIIFFIGSQHSDKVKGLFNNIIEAFKFFRNNQVLMLAVPLTFFIWLILYGFSVLLALHALDIHIGYSGAILFMAITSISSAILSSPGNIGTREFFSLVILVFLGVEYNRALSFAFLMHFLGELPNIIIGLYYLRDELFRKKGTTLNEILDV